MNEGQHFYGVSGDAIDQDIVGMDDDLARAGRAAWPVRVGMQRQIIGGVPNRSVEAIRRCLVAGTDIVKDVEQGCFGLIIPDDRQGHVYLSRTACALAITSPCGMRCLVEASARSTLARTHASCASASSLVANSDSMGVSLVMEKI